MKSNSILGLALATIMGLAPVLAHAQVVAGTYPQSFSAPVNYIKNPNCALNVANVTSTNATTTRVTSTNSIYGPTSCSFTFSALAGTVKFNAKPLDKAVAGGNCEARFLYNGSTMAGAKAYVEQNTGSGFVKASNDLQLGASTDGILTSILVPCGGTTVTGTNVVIESTTTGVSGKATNVSFGPATNIGSVQQSYLKGTLAVTGCTDWNRASTTYGSFGTSTGCVYAATGDVLAPTTMVPGFRVQNVGAGNYMIVARGGFNKTATTTNADLAYRFTDGTNTFSPNVFSIGSASGQYQTASSITGSISYLTAQPTTSFEIQGAVGTTTGGTVANISVVNTYTSASYLSGLLFEVYYFPSQSQLAISQRLPTQSTLTKLDTGSGNFIVPLGATSLTIKAVAAGGAGGAAFTVTGNTGGTTTFGSLTLAGGVGGTGGNGGTPGAGGAGGAVPTIPSGWQGTASAGSNGGAVGTAFVQGGDGGPGGLGGSFGKAGPLVGGSGSAANVNSGGGGGGMGSNPGNYYASGGGGGGASFVGTLPVVGGQTIAYAIGAGGTSSNGGGGTGGSGYVEVWVNYQGMQAPILVGGVVSSSAGVERMERVRVAPSCTSSPCTISSQSGNFASSVTRNSTGNYTVNFTTPFSGAPSCSPRCFNNANVFFVDGATGGSGTSSTAIVCYNSAAAVTDAGFELICQGPK